MSSAGGADDSVGGGAVGGRVVVAASVGVGAGSVDVVTVGSTVDTSGSGTIAGAAKAVTQGVHAIWGPITDGRAVILPSAHLTWPGP